jgi:hypothetical protein
MALHDDTLDKTTVLTAVDDARRALESDDASIKANACDALGIGTADWVACRAELIDELSEAEDWVEREDALSAVAGPAPLDSDEGPEFLPSHPTLAVVQSAMEEYIEARPGHRFLPRDPKWLSVVYQKLRARARGKAPFIEHQHLTDFQIALPERCRVALVSDWGTANLHAIAVAQRIAEREPHHVIHLGDVYYSGTPREVQRNFLDIWQAYGPRHSRYWALNANHEMYSGGHGYFQHILPAFGQPASYFSLQNRYWRLLALDTGYATHHFSPPQMPWLEAQLQGSARNILLTHHHLFSPFRKPGDALEEQLDPVLRDGRVFAWFWGHDHHLIEYADYRGMKCRCIGHGSIPYVPPDRRRIRNDVAIVRMETRPTPLHPGRGMHGFALLTFDGAALQIEYVDEAGGTAWSEVWERGGN